MKNIWVENIIRVIVLISLQILLFNNLDLWGVCCPSIYVIILLSLPIQMPRALELIIGFLIGLIIDISCNTLGAHTAACTLLSYARPLLINNMIQDKERIIGTFGSAKVGMATYTKITGILILMHHTMLFMLISFNASRWWITLLQILLSSIITFLFTIGYNIVKSK